MRVNARLLGGLAIIFLAMPLWGRPNATHVDKIPWTPDHAAKIGNKDFDPGSYQLQARESENQVDVLKDGKVVAQVPCHWVQLPKKADETEIVSNDDNVIQVQFKGRPEAIQFQ